MPALRHFDSDIQKPAHITAQPEAVLAFNQHGETNESIALGLGYTEGSCFLRQSLEKDQKGLKT